MVDVTAIYQTAHGGQRRSVVSYDTLAEAEAAAAELRTAGEAVVVQVFNGETAIVSTEPEMIEPAAEPESEVVAAPHEQA